MFGVGWVHVRRMTEVWRQIAAADVASDCSKRCRGGARRRTAYCKCAKNGDPPRPAFRHSRKARCCWSSPSEIRNSTFTTLMAKSHRLACRPGELDSPRRRECFLFWKRTSATKAISIPALKCRTCSASLGRASRYTQDGSDSAHRTAAFAYRTTFREHLLRHDQGWQSRHCDRG